MCSRMLFRKLFNNGSSFKNLKRLFIWFVGTHITITTEGNASDYLLTLFLKFLGWQKVLKGNAGNVCNVQSFWSHSNVEISLCVWRLGKLGCHFKNIMEVLDFRHHDHVFCAKFSAFLTF